MPRYAGQLIQLANDSGVPAAPEAKCTHPDRQRQSRRRLYTDTVFARAFRGGAAATYGISKAALNALTSTLVAELAATPVIVNAVCPGLTATYPGAEAMGARPVAQSAAGVVWAATLPDDGPRGGFFRDGKPLDW